MSGQVLTQASRQWASRADDERFLSIADLKQHVQNRRNESWTTAPQSQDIRVLPEGEDLRVQVMDPTKGEKRLLTPTNWSFSQLAGHAGAPAAYLRKLPAQLAAINMQWGLSHNAAREEALVLAHSNGNNVLRAVTSPTYGRIWDIEVVNAVEKVNGDGRWQVPSASYSTRNPKRATTLYASDRDVFIFLVDPKNPIEVNGEQLFRGFMTWNSEVGAATFGLTTFLYRYVCDNRMIWGATEIKELRIRHTGGAPQRFAYEGARYLKKYADESTGQLVETIKAAQNYDIVQKELKKDQTVEDWLQKNGFTKAQAKAGVESANMEEGQARSLWDIINGITAYARSIPNTDDRVLIETRAGALMNRVTTVAA